MSNYDIYILIFLSLLGFVLNKKVKDEDLSIAINTILFCFIFGYLTCVGIKLFLN